MMFAKAWLTQACITSSMNHLIPLEDNPEEVPKYSSCDFSQSKSHEVVQAKKDDVKAELAG